MTGEKQRAAFAGPNGSEPATRGTRTKERVDKRECREEENAKKLEQQQQRQQHSGELVISRGDFNRGVYSIAAWQAGVLVEAGSTNRRQGEKRNETPGRVPEKSRVPRKKCKEKKKKTR